jgi:hypothetical protein
VTPFPQSNQLLTNNTGSFLFTDVAGNTGSASYAVTWIDKTPPQAISLTYAPQVFTTGGVTATLITDEPVFLPAGWSGAATGTLFTKWYTSNISGLIVFTDLVGNQGSTGILITRTDEDTDGDGVPDYVEENDGTDPDDKDDYKDTDGDKVPDYVEENEGTDPDDKDDYKDTDGDNVPDYVEENEGTNPDDKDDYKDTDGDNVPDYVEKNEGTDPDDKDDYKDTDGDKVPDYVEENEGTDPDDKDDYKDTDGDKVPDYVEENEGTNPDNKNDYKDSDKDGVPDYVEKNEGTDPNNPNDYLDNNRNGIPDYIEARRPSSGGGVTLKKDDCPDGDFSPSYYDKKCDASIDTDDHGAPDEQASTEKV